MAEAIRCAQIGSLAAESLVAANDDEIDWDDPSDPVYEMAGGFSREVWRQIVQTALAYEARKGERGGGGGGRAARRRDDSDSEFEAFTDESEEEEEDEDEDEDDATERWAAEAAAATLSANADAGDDDDDDGGERRSSARIIRDRRRAAREKAKAERAAAMRAGVLATLRSIERERERSRSSEGGGERGGERGERDADAIALVRFALAQGADVALALDAMRAVAAEKAKEVESTCERHYGDFAAAMGELDGVSSSSAALGRASAAQNESLRAATTPLVETYEALSVSRAVSKRAKEAADAVARCQLALECAQRCGEEAREGRLFRALRRVEDLEQKHLPGLPCGVLEKSVHGGTYGARDAIARAGVVSATEWLARARDAARSLGLRELEDVAGSMPGGGVQEVVDAFLARNERDDATWTRRRAAVAAADSGDVAAVRKVVDASVAAARAKAEDARKAAAERARRSNDAAAESSESSESAAGGGGGAPVPAGSAGDGEHTPIKRRIDFAGEVADLEKRRVVPPAAVDSNADARGGKESAAAAAAVTLDVVPLLRADRLFARMHVSEEFYRKFQRDRAMQLKADLGGETGVWATACVFVFARPTASLSFPRRRRSFPPKP